MDDTSAGTKLCVPVDTTEKLATSSPSELFCSAKLVVPACTAGAVYATCGGLFWSMTPSSVRVMIRAVVRVTAVTGMLTVRVVGAAYVPMVTANCSLGAIFGCKSCVNVMATCVPSALTVIALAVGATGAAAEATLVPTTVKPLASRAQLIAATPICRHLRRNVMCFCREIPNNVC